MLLRCQRISKTSSPSCARFYPKRIEHRHTSHCHPNPNSQALHPSFPLYHLPSPHRGKSARTAQWLHSLCKCGEECCTCVIDTDVGAMLTDTILLWIIYVAVLDRQSFCLSVSLSVFPASIHSSSEKVVPFILFIYLTRVQSSCDDETLTTAVVFCSRNEQLYGSNISRS